MNEFTVRKNKIATRITRILTNRILQIKIPGFIGSLPVGVIRVHSC